MKDNKKSQTIRAVSNPFIKKSPQRNPRINAVDAQA